jgi:hypothetical protein
LLLEPAPVDTQRIEQSWAQHDVAILASLAAADMDDHALAVDVADLQVSDFSAPSAGGIQRHQQDAVEGPLRCIDETCDLLLAEHLRQVQDLLRVWRLGNAPPSLQNLT